MILERVAIIVPIYNVEKYVEKCLKSLSNQTYKNIKIYAIIDGSPDNSIQIVKKMASEDQRIICIEKENGGYGSVLEYAINNIVEKYFLICDPDDWIKENTIETLYQRMVEQQLDIIVGDKYLVYSDANYREEYSSSNKNGKVIPNRVYVKEDIGKFSFLSVSPHAKMYRTEPLKGVIFPKKVSYTDYFLYMYALTKSSRVMYMEDALAYYLIDRQGNSTTDKSKKSLSAHIVVWQYTYDIIDRFNNRYLLFSLYEGLKGLIIYYSKIYQNEESDDFHEIGKFRSNLGKYIKEIKKNEMSIIKRMEISIILNKKIKLDIIIKLIRILAKFKLERRKK